VPHQLVNNLPVMKLEKQFELDQAWTARIKKYPLKPEKQLQGM